MGKAALTKNLEKFTKSPFILWIFVIEWRNFFADVQKAMAYCFLKSSFLCLLVGYAIMAVQQNKKSAAKRGNHRSHDHLTNPATAVEAKTGEVHLRHHISPNGFYRGKKVIAVKGE